MAKTKAKGVSRPKISKKSGKPAKKSTKKIGDIICSRSSRFTPPSKAYMKSINQLLALANRAS